jgi:hypothetical protein
MRGRHCGRKVEQDGDAADQTLLKGKRGPATPSQRSHRRFPSVHSQTESTIVRTPTLDASRRCACRKCLRFTWTGDVSMFQP